MCGRYYIAEDDQAEELRQIIDMINRKSNGEGAVKTCGEIFPSETVPMIAASRSQKIMPFAMEWGYSTSEGNRLINARSETAAQKPAFRDGMLHRRCIIPASWYFEWNRNEKGKPKYAIGAEHRNVICMAGIYRFEQERPVFSILTREPAESIQFIHNRMPVILPRETVRDWLNTEYAAEEVLKKRRSECALPADLMRGMICAETEKRLKRCCFTGHRPGKLMQNEKTVKSALNTAIDQAIDRGFTTFITGMAQGTDIWAAEIVLEKRRTNPALKLICALPHPNFEKPWQADWQARFSEVLHTADLQRTIWPVYAKSSYQKRNIWMVDHSALLIAVFSGKAGGTLNTIHYAQQKHVEIMYADMQSEGFHDPV